MDHDDVPVLTGERLRLRPPEERDIAVRAGFGRRREIVRSFGGDLDADEPLDLDDAAAQLAARFGPGPHWVIADSEDDYVGLARLAPLDVANRSSRFAIGLHDPERLGMGLGTEATRLVVDYAFEVLDLHRVGLTVMADNVRAVACYRKVGFEIEGRLRDTLWRDGRWHDDLVMAVLNPNDVGIRRRTPRPDGRPGPTVDT